jgi:hypothetical protein
MSNLGRIMILFLICMSCFNENDYDQNLTKASDYISLITVSTEIQADGKSNLLLEARLTDNVVNPVLVTFLSSRGGYFANSKDTIIVKSSLELIGNKTTNVARTQIISKLDTGTTVIQAKAGNYIANEQVKIKFIPAPPNYLELEASDFEVIDQFDKKVELTAKLLRNNGSTSLLYKVAFQALDSLGQSIGSFQNDTVRADGTGVFKTSFGIGQIPKKGKAIRIIGACVEVPSVKNKVTLITKPK